MIMEAATQGWLQEQALQMGSDNVRKVTDAVEAKQASGGLLQEKAFTGGLDEVEKDGQI